MKLLNENRRWFTDITPNLKLIYSSESDKWMLFFVGNVVLQILLFLFSSPT